MAQPIRKKIKEEHSDLIKELPFRTLLIDGNSLLFMCMRDEKVNVDGVHYGAIYQFLLQLRIHLQKGEFQYVYVFFDDEYSGLLRYEIYDQYKANRDKHYSEYGQSDYMKACNDRIRSMQTYFNSKNKAKTYKNDQEKFIDENFDRERDILCEYFNELYIRWYIDEVVEGDDLIAYYCLNKKPNEKIIIVSGDMDIMQLLSDDVSIYNLHKKKYITNKNFKQNYGYYYGNILIKKILTGDSSDNISNIAGLTEDGFFKIMPEAKEQQVTIDQFKDRIKELSEERAKNNKKPLKLHENILNGVSNKKYDGDFYDINEKLINLKKPLLSKEAKEEMDNMMYIPQDPTDRSASNLYKLILRDGITELNNNTKFAEFFRPFKQIEEKEKKMFEKWKN